MKAILEFELPEEREEFEDAQKGSYYKAKIDTLYDVVFRPHLKYDKKLFDDNVLTEVEYKVIEEIMAKVLSHLQD
jgi:hypothetical protein